MRPRPQPSPLRGLLRASIAVVVLIILLVAAITVVASVMAPPATAPTVPPTAGPLLTPTVPILQTPAPVPTPTSHKKKDIALRAGLGPPATARGGHARGYSGLPRTWQLSLWPSVLADRASLLDIVRRGAHSAARAG